MYYVWSQSEVVYAWESTVHAGQAWKVASIIQSADMHLVLVESMEILHVLLEGTEKNTRIWRAQIVMLSFLREMGTLHEMRWDAGSPRSVHTARMEDQIFEVFLKTAYTQYQIAGRLVPIDLQHVYTSYIIRMSAESPSASVCTRCISQTCIL